MKTKTIMKTNGKLFAGVLAPSLLVPLAHGACATYPNASVSEFDYVIIGGGTAGLVVANRLTEDSSVTVAVIEAGTWPEDVHGNWTQVPFYQSRFANNSDPMMWPFSTTPQTYVSNISFPYYRAKALGGCSAVNAMAYTQSTTGAHQVWADSVNDEAYIYDNYLQFYHRTMDFTPPTPGDRFTNATPLYNPADTVTSGTLNVTYSRYAQPWTTWLSQGLAAIGIAKEDTFINGKIMGQAYNMDTITETDSIRSSSETAYLRPILSRKNLAVFDLTMASRIVFNSEKEATGVETTNGHTFTAKKEVILSAGFAQSPHLLMVSGVGPSDLLSSLDIPVVADLPGVGQNMKDQFSTFLTYQVGVETADALSIPDILEPAINEWNENGSGPLASAGGDLYGFELIPKNLRSNWSEEVIETLARFPSDWPHVGYAAFPSLGEGNYAITVNPLLNYASVLMTTQATSSIGSVSITSADIRDTPLIDLGALSNEADVVILIAAIKRMRAAFASKELNPILIGEEVLPGAAYQTDEELLTYLQTNTYSQSHGASTCRMGAANDTTAVVNSKGQVFGVSNLRIIDGSVLPFVPPGPSIQIQVYTVAEKLVQDIKDTIS